MIKKVNKNKFGVIEYLIEDMEDLKNLPKKDTDNTTYAIMRKGNEKLIYLYSSSTKEWMLINEDLSSIKSSLDNIEQQIKQIITQLNGTTPQEKADLLSSAICFYEPENVPNDWVTDSTGKILNVTTEQFYDLFYNPYLGNSNYGSVTKTSLGKDQSGLYDLYEYDFKPKNYNRTILLTSGMHTYELSAHFGCAWLIKSIMENYQNNAMLKYLYDNVRIKIIPIVNPWGWSQSPKKYGNVNGVNINRNFDYTDDSGNSVWTAYPTYTPQQNEWNVKGSAPFSESETVILRDWALANKNAEFWIDCHTGLEISQVDNFIYYSSNSKLKSRIEKSLLRLSNRIKTLYNTTSTNKVIIDSDGSIRLRWGERVAGIPGMTLEQTPNNTKWGTGLNNESGDIANYCTTLLSYIVEFLITFYDSDIEDGGESGDTEDGGESGDTEDEFNPTIYDEGEPTVPSDGIINLIPVQIKTDGLLMTSQTRYSTKEYIPVNSTTLFLDTTNVLFDNVSLKCYDSNKNYLGGASNGWVNTSTIVEFRALSKTTYIKLMFKQSDDRILTSEYSNGYFVINGELYYTENSISSVNNLTVTSGALSATTGEVTENVNRFATDFIPITNQSFNVSLITGANYGYYFRYYDIDKNYLGRFDVLDSTTGTTIPTFTDDLLYSFNLNTLQSNIKFIKISGYNISNKNSAIDMTKLYGQRLIIDNVHYIMVCE